MKITFATLSALLLGAVLYGCADRPTPLGPAAATPPTAAVTGGVAVQVTPLTRNVPLATDLSVTGTIGAKGGWLQIPEAGIRINVPANAVAAPVTITMTALAGRPVAYTFAPHGLLFSRAVRVEVSLTGTAAEGNRSLQDVLEAGYFPGQFSVDATTGTVDVTERLPLGLDVTRTRAIFSIRHFSGYILASGKGKK
jgi:hypothetical protein